MIPCKICGTPTRSFHSPQQKANYYSCPQCEYISKDENQRVSPFLEKTEYDLHLNSYDDAAYVRRFKEMIDHGVLKYVSLKNNESKPSALDFGSGPTPVLARVLAQDYGFKTDIYDLYYSPEKIYTGKTYSLITCTEVVEHLHDPVQVFKLLKHHLNADGVLSIMTLFHPCNDKAFVKWHYHRDVTHIGFFTPKTMAYIAQLLDLTIVYLNDHQICSFKHQTHCTSF